MEYSADLIRQIEEKWREKWQEDKTYSAKINSEKPKHYVLDMFPYPSGAGLHVGHPLGYIASDIHARFKRLQGYNVLHPMGYDAFGLPAEQYAIQTGQHPAVTTEQNIKRYREQLDRLGFSFDWDREVRTCDPEYYKWTQWIFLQLFDSWYCKDADKALPISQLIEVFEQEGNKNLNAVCDEDTEVFAAEDWKNASESEKETILQKYRLAYLSEAVVNWCPELGTVLANDEVKDGVSERGGFPVEQKKMKQWSMRITAYAQRLLDGLDKLDWPDAIKEVQRNWIGRSQGAAIWFDVSGSDRKIEVFTTRPDTIFGVSFMVLAPEHELVQEITTDEQRSEVEKYIEQTKKRSERERMADVKNVSGAFTGAYVEHPFTEEQIPVWIGDYVLAGYGTGAIMAVPSGDQRDWDFAKNFDLPVPNVIEGADISEGANDQKSGKLTNSQFLDGLKVKDAIKKAIGALIEKGIGQKKINYKLRDAVFGRQRYWGEPIPIYYENGVPKSVRTEHLPLELPEVESYLPTKDGEPPLKRADEWNYDPERGVVPNGEGFPLELTTMPGWAGSSWYFLRYEDPNNSEEFASQEAVNYWKNVDFYMGGAEHGTGHLLYFRFWTKLLNDRGHIPFDEPAQKLTNQGMIQGNSAIIYILDKKTNGITDNNFGYQLNFEKPYTIAFSNEPEFDFKNKGVQVRNIPVNAVKGNFIDFQKLSESEVWKNFSDIIFLTQKGYWLNNKFTSYEDSPFAFKRTNIPISVDVSDTPRISDFIVDWEVEKMSKSKFNVINPDDLCDQYGADALRLHEMFLGPVEMHKPWNTQGIDGVSKFLKRFWRLFHSGDEFSVIKEKPTKDELKVLHTCIKAMTEDLEKDSFNTCVSNLMICVNELSSLKCNKREILEPLSILASCHAPHITEELWEKLGHKSSIMDAGWPQLKEEYLTEDEIEYPVSFNGKKRFSLKVDANLSKDEVEKAVLEHERTGQQLKGNEPKKIIVVPGRIVNVVH